MLTLVVVALWFGLVAVYLVRQWWVSELAQVRGGVPAPEPVTLPAAPQAPATAPAFSWSALHATSAPAR